MKRLLLLAALLGGAMGAYAQDCDAVLPPYYLDFETAVVPNLPDCTWGVNTTNNGWVTATNPGSGFTNGTLQYTANSEAATAWFFTRPLELETGKAYRITFTYGNNSATTVEKLTVAYGPTASAAGMTHNINNYNSITGATPATITVGPVYITEGGTNYFGFKANSDASQGSLYLDDISIVPWVCETVNNFAATSITPTAATLTWEAATGGETVQFQQVSVVAYGESPSASAPTTTDLFKDLADLTPGTTYTASIRTFCSGTWGDWVSINFTTPVCSEVAAIPYIQDFESATTPGIPACNLALTGETGGNWATADAPGSGFTSKALTYAATDETADAWFFTQGFELEAGGHYKISYTYGNNGATAENLSVALVRAPAPLWVTGFFAEHTGITGGTPVTYVHGNSFTINENSGGTYYLAFHAASDANQGSLFVDDIKVEEWTCTAPSAITATDITTNSATITWVAPDDSVVMGYFYAYNTTGETPTEFTMNPGATLNLEGLEPGTTYYLFVKSFCGPVIGEWAAPVTFTTQELAGITDVAFNGLAVYPNPAHNNITISNAQQIDSAALYNVAGQQVLQQSINATTGKIQLQQLPAGVYLLTLQYGNAAKTIKVIKQ